MPLQAQPRRAVSGLAGTCRAQPRRAVCRNVQPCRLRPLDALHFKPSVKPVIARPESPDPDERTTRANVLVEDGRRDTVVKHQELRVTLPLVDHGELLQDAPPSTGTPMRRQEQPLAATVVLFKRENKRRNDKHASIEVPRPCRL